MKPRLLLVDDNDANRECLVDLLGSEFEIDVARNAKEAILLAAPGRYQVAILDVKMPERDGISLFEELKANDPGLSAIFYSAYPGEYAKSEQCRKLGAFIRKGRREDLEKLILQIHLLVEPGKE